MLLFLGLSVHSHAAERRVPNLRLLSAQAKTEQVITLDSIVGTDDQGRFYKKVSAFDEHGYLVSEKVYQRQGTQLVLNTDKETSWEGKYTFDEQGRCVAYTQYSYDEETLQPVVWFSVEADYEGEYGMDYVERVYDWAYGRGRYQSGLRGYDSMGNPSLFAEWESDDKLGIVLSELHLYTQYRIHTSQLYSRNPDWRELRRYCFSDFDYEVHDGDFRGYRSLFERSDSKMRVTYQELSNLSSADRTLDRTAPLETILAQVEALWDKCRKDTYEELLFTDDRTRIARTEYYDEGYLRDVETLTYDEQNRLSKLAYLDYYEAENPTPEVSEFVYVEGSSARTVTLDDMLNWYIWMVDDGDITDFAAFYELFGQLQTLKGFEYEDDIMEFDEWDEYGHFTHGKATYSNLSEGDVVSSEVWRTLRGDFSTKEIVEDELHQDGTHTYRKEVYVYNQWNELIDIEYYKATSLNGPWTDGDDVSEPVSAYAKAKALKKHHHARRRAYQSYDEDGFRVTVNTETDDEGNITWGHMTKVWKDTFVAPTPESNYRHPATPFQVEEDEEYESLYPYQEEYYWQDGTWVLDYVGGEKTIRQSDGSVRCEHYTSEGEYDYERGITVIIPKLYGTDEYVFDEAERLVSHVNMEGEANEVNYIDSYTYYEDTDYVATCVKKRSGYADQLYTYYYKERPWLDPTDEVSLPTMAEGQENSTWYTLDGRCLTVRPTQAGIYLHGGRKVVVK